MTTGQAEYVGMYTNVSRSNYNSGQFTLRKRFGQGFQGAANYTWSKSMDITSQGEAAGSRPGSANSQGQIMDPYHPNLNYGLSDFNRPSQFNGTLAAELPFGSGKLIGGGAGNRLNQVIGGWSASGIFVATSGRPWSYTSSSRYSLHYFGRDLPIPTGQPINYSLHKDTATNGQIAVYYIADPASDIELQSCLFKCESYYRRQLLPYTISWFVGDGAQRTVWPWLLQPRFIA